MSKLIIICSAAMAITFGSSSMWLYSKSILGQVLLELAWQKTLITDDAVKAWPWADTWPVAKLKVDNTGASLIVLEGVSGEALAFGPGRIAGLSSTAEAGTYAIGGHRDSHLAFLEHINNGDTLSLQTRDGAESRFTVTEQFVADSATESMVVNEHLHALVLITCYPFNALQTGGDLRYVVVAHAAA